MGKSKKLVPTRIDFGNLDLTVAHVLSFTMLDGKVAQVITNTSSSSNCFICGARPTEMNDLEKLQRKTVNPDALVLGISPLHARIKFMEYVLHLGYNMQFKAWRCSKSTELMKKAEKDRILSQLKNKLWLRVDFVKQGYGSSNTGNTSRKFFLNASVISDVTKVDENLIRRFGVILDVINTSSRVNPSEFGKYAKETAEIAIRQYPWYYMPQTVHKVLFHGQEIIEAAALPIGVLSEEAQESRHKDYKYVRQHHTRKHARVSTNEDIFNKFLESSDPFVTSMRPETKKKHLPLSEEAIKLLF